MGAHGGGTHMTDLKLSDSSEKCDLMLRKEDSGIHIDPKMIAK